MYLKEQSKISDQLRVAIETAGESRYAISKRTGISQSILSRFVNGETKLDGVNFDKLAAYLGLRLVQMKRRRKER